MARDIVIFGETLIQVQGDPSYPPLSDLGALGLTDRQGQVVIIPKFYHKDVKADDFGPDAPAEIISMMAEATIRMTLVHYDEAILEACIAQSSASQVFGTMAGAGTLLGNNANPLAPFCRFITLTLTNPVSNRPWKFKTSYLTDPLEMPQGTMRSKPQLTWRAIPYAKPNFITGEVLSSGTVVWSRPAMSGMMTSGLPL